VFHARVRDAFSLVCARACELNGASLVVVSHGLFCASLVSTCARLPDGTPAPSRFGNTSVTLVDPLSPFLVSLLNDVSHLSGTALDDERAPSGL
jgi:broad specificity phosphatase PhoE